MSEFSEKLKSIQFGNVTPPAERPIEKQWERDLPAYKRLREQGYQPPRTQGCAQLEAEAHMDREVNMGRLINPAAWAQVGNMITDAEAAAATATEVTPAEIREWKHKR